MEHLTAAAIYMSERVATITIKLDYANFLYYMNQDGDLAATDASGLAASVEAIGKSGDLSQLGGKLLEMQSTMDNVVQRLQSLTMETAA